jgi:hypothetical protein
VDGGFWLGVIEEDGGREVEAGKVCLGILLLPCIQADETRRRGQEGAINSVKDYWERERAGWSTSLVGLHEEKREGGRKKRKRGMVHG